jgi:hypothetical protein
VGTAHPSWIDTDMVRDADADLEQVAEMRQSGPGFLGATTSVGECARQLADAIERRAGRVCVPRSAVVLNWLRSVIGGPVAARVMRRRAAEAVPVMEERVATLGRSVSERTAAVDAKL